MPLIIKALGKIPFQETFQAMQQFTAERDEYTVDEVWLCEHEPVFTQGRHGHTEHILDTQGIDIVQTDRGGQVTYHGPGQLMVYFLWDLKRLNIGPKKLVCMMEQSIIDTLKAFNIKAERRAGSPGIYVAEKKIASLGLRIKRGLSYHGLALNVDMNLEPFQFIHPCGHEGLVMTQVKDFVPNIKMLTVKQIFMAKLRTHRAALEVHDHDN